MKTRASNLMIGSATLAVIAAAFAGFLAFQKIHGIRQQTPLRIVFEGSATGLRKGGSVNFDGIQIGQIKLPCRANRDYDAATRKTLPLVKILVRSSVGSDPQFCSDGE